MVNRRFMNFVLHNSSHDTLERIIFTLINELKLASRSCSTLNSCNVNIRQQPDTGTQRSKKLIKRTVIYTKPEQCLELLPFGM